MLTANQNAEHAVALPIRRFQLSEHERQLQLFLPGGRRRLTLLLAFLFLGLVATVEAAGGGAEQAVMAGIVTGNTANRGAFEAPLGVGRRDGCRRKRGDGEQGGKGFHVGSLLKMSQD
jgi:hypothetical protein